MTRPSEIDHTDARLEPSAATSDPSLDARWVRLQRFVALGEVAVFAGIMLFVRGQFIPPLAVASLLFAAGAAATLRVRRAGAIAVGAISTLWLGSNIAFASQVIPDLLAIEVTEIFLPTFAMNVLAAAGVVGLVGALRRAQGTVAATTRSAAVALIGLGTAASVVMGVL